MPTNESAGLSTARSLVHALAAELLAEQHALPLGIFGTPVPRHYTINTIRDTLATLDNRLADIEAPRHNLAPRLRRGPFVSVAHSRCYRCGGQAVHEWSTCAVGDRWLALCDGCDVLLNRLALGFVIGPERAAAFVDRYERQLRERATDPAERQLQSQRRCGVASVPARRQRAKARGRRRQKKARQVVSKEQAEGVTT